MDDVSTGARFWKMDNRFWVIDDPGFSDGGVATMVIGFMSREELCCESAEVQLDCPSREIDYLEMDEILTTHGSIVIWDLHTRNTLLMTRRVD